MGKLASLAGKASKFAKNSKIVKGVMTVAPTAISVSSFSDSAVAVTGITSPVEATKVAFKLVLKKCIPPEWYVVSECLLFIGYFIDFIATGGSWQGAPILVWLANFVLTKVKGE